MLERDYLIILLILILAIIFCNQQKNEGFANTRKTPLATFQQEFNKAGCTRTLTEDNVKRWRTSSMNEFVDNAVKLNNLTKNCTGTGAQRDFCDPGNQCVPSNKTPLAEYQKMFRMAGCKRILTEDDVKPWRTIPMMEFLGYAMNLGDLTKNCAGTDTERNFCDPNNQCKTTD
jgi:hypothetical protein